MLPRFVNQHSLTFYHGFGGNEGELRESVAVSMETDPETESLCLYTSITLSRRLIWQMRKGQLDFEVRKLLTTHVNFGEKFVRCDGFGIMDSPRDFDEECHKYCLDIFS
ncbi:hypothetical protein CDAR_114641 [Caerostris darwini]|uniref:Uncharacterized protein n=1 Tax=Caerostris darwini TaxID=1538125 RepID=A0AAV4R3U8_9ARAC|nr:hypothetical protein CDAR_114641 [Caerostris darwini]